jgi:hypothetical protein
MSSSMRDYYLPWTVSRETTAIEAVFKSAKKTWYKAGYLTFESNGLQIPYDKPLSFGRSIITSPSFPEGQPYRIKFRPAYWVGGGRLRFWEFLPTRKAVRQSPISFADFSPQEISLLGSVGITPTLNRLTPELLEVVIPLLSLLKSIQINTENLQTMASTDIRSLLNNLEALTTQTAANTSTAASQAVKLADVIATAIIEKNFTIEKIGFFLEGSVYRASINHMMGTRTPGVTIYDADGDLQLAEFIAVDKNNAKLELTPSQYADNAFPLTVNLQARNAATVAQPAGMNGYAVPGSVFKVRFNVLGRLVERSQDDFVTSENIGGSSAIAGAKIAPDGQVWVASDAGGYYYSPIINGEWKPSTAGDYQNLDTLTGTVLL